MTAAASVTATFVQQFTVTVTLSGNGGGHITSAPAGLDCSSPQCGAVVDAGSIFQLSPSADPVSRFSGWSGACTGTGACAVTVSGNVQLGATFVQQFDIQASVVGSGSVQSHPAGIACPGDCSDRYDTNTDVVLTATAAPGWRFSGWGAAQCQGDAPVCVQSASQYEARMVTAFFIEQLPLTVVMAGNGSGSVAGAGFYDAGTIVTLTATPDASSVFAGWAGACTGMGACTVTMSGPQTVTATFTLRQYPLDV